MLKLRMIVTWKDTWEDKSRQHFCNVIYLFMVFVLEEVLE